MNYDFGEVSLLCQRALDKWNEIHAGGDEHLLVHMQWGDCDFKVKDFWIELIQILLNEVLN